MTTMLLAQDFPPMGGGIARLHEELARRFPPGELIVSTPADRCLRSGRRLSCGDRSTPNLRPQYENPAGATTAAAPAGYACCEPRVGPGEAPPQGARRLSG